MEQQQINTPQEGTQDVPNATGVLVLGIVSLVVWFCYGIPGIVCAIIALVISKKGKLAYEANPSAFKQSSYNNLKAGRVCSIIGLVLGSLWIVWILIALIFVGAGMMSGMGRF